MLARCLTVCGTSSRAYSSKKIVSWTKCCHELPQRIGTRIACSTTTERLSKKLFRKHPGGCWVWKSWPCIPKAVMTCVALQSTSPAVIVTSSTLNSSRPFRL
eukprot:926436-Rhodomonas_salina.3